MGRCGGKNSPDRFGFLTYPLETLRSVNESQRLMAQQQVCPGRNGMVPRHLSHQPSFGFHHCGVSLDLQVAQPLLQKGGGNERHKGVAGPLVIQKSSRANAGILSLGLKAGVTILHGSRQPSFFSSKAACVSNLAVCSARFLPEEFGGFNSFVSLCTVSFPFPSELQWVSCESR